MAGKRGRPPKGEFDDLPMDFKEAVEHLAPEEINMRIAEVAKSEVENLENKKADQDLAEKLAAAKEAGAQYRDATKQNKLKIRFMKRVLGDKGKA
jgi:hypothetical protein